MSIAAALGGALKTAAGYALGGLAQGAIGALFGGGSTPPAAPHPNVGGPLALPGGYGGPVSVSRMPTRGGTPTDARLRAPAVRLSPASPVPGWSPGSGMAYEYGVYRRRRRMNVCNVRALRRSLRRLDGFEKVVKKVMTFSRGGAPRKVTFKRRKRR